MLQSVDIGERHMDAYAGIVDDDLLHRLHDAAGQLRGTRVLHLSATPYGGGVSELLRSAVPLLNDIGLVADWQIIGGNPAFFEITKRIHNGLQGGDVTLSHEDRASYFSMSERNAQLLEGRWDVAVVHDPQPAALARLDPDIADRWIWRCHIDTSTPNRSVWDFVRPFLGYFHAAVFTMREFVPPDLPVAQTHIIPPAIDPLSPKNIPLHTDLSRRILEWIGIRTDRPLVTQVSRFDPWKDPHGVIDAYLLAREQIPDLQLALVGSMAGDDPEAWGIYADLREASQSDPAMHLFTNLQGVGNIEVNAFQCHSRAIIQKSIREGFGLVVSEAMWKRTPVIAGRAGGIPLQMADDTGGRLVDSTEQCARAIIDFVQDHQLHQTAGEAGHRRVRDHFLLPRLLLNELSLLADVLGSSSAERRIPADVDPVCGMALSESEVVAAYDIAGRTYHFCSHRCKQRFVHDPDRWTSHGPRG